MFFQWLNSYILIDQSSSYANSIIRALCMITLCPIFPIAVGLCSKVLGKNSYMIDYTTLEWFYQLCMITSCHLPCCGCIMQQNTVFNSYKILHIIGSWWLLDRVFYILFVKAKWDWMLSYHQIYFIIPAPLYCIHMCWTQYQKRRWTNESVLYHFSCDKQLSR